MSFFSFAILGFVSYLILYGEWPPIRNILQTSFCWFFFCIYLSRNILVRMFATIESNVREPITHNGFCFLGIFSRSKWLNKRHRKYYGYMVSVTRRMFLLIRAYVCVCVSWCCKCAILNSPSLSHMCVYAKGWYIQLNRITVVVACAADTHSHTNSVEKLCICSMWVLCKWFCDLAMPNRNSQWMDFNERKTI